MLAETTASRAAAAAGLGWPVSPMTDPRLTNIGIAIAAKRTSAGGIPDTATLLNGTYPGPEIRAQEGDRLRIINASTQRFFRVMVDGHPLTVTHTGGYPVHPVETDSLLLGVAERYDLIVEPKTSGAFAALGYHADEPDPSIAGEGIGLSL